MLDANRFYNKRTQMYWEFAQKLRRRSVAVPRHKALWRELMAIRYKTEGGIVRLEKKKDIAKRLGNSPDYADAAVYGDFVRAPLPMEQEAQEQPDANRQDRAMPLNLDGVHGRRTPKLPKASEDLEAIFQNAARVQARRQRFPRPRW